MESCERDARKTGPPGMVPPGLKRWPFKLIKHFVNTTRVSPSPAGPAGCCPLNFLNLINLKFECGHQMDAAYSSLGQSSVTKV